MIFGSKYLSWISFPRSAAILQRESLWAEREIAWEKGRKELTSLFSSTGRLGVAVGLVEEAYLISSLDMLPSWLFLTWEYLPPFWGHSFHCFHLYSYLFVHLMLLKNIMWDAPLLCWRPSLTPRGNAHVFLTPKAPRTQVERWGICICSDAVIMQYLCLQWLADSQCQIPDSPLFSPTTPCVR